MTIDNKMINFRKILSINHGLVCKKCSFKITQFRKVFVYTYLKLEYNEENIYVSVHTSIQIKDNIIA